MFLSRITSRRQPPQRTSASRVEQYNVSLDHYSSHSEIGDMLGEGWIIEGPVFCGLP